ncbi:MAG: hypothetical protein NC043_00295 [Muribaculaceae bacterium]|nr:hypothetical protein [Muribaculaceae bacterium]
MAASIAVLIALGTNLLTHIDATNSECVAYAAGHRIESHDAIMELVSSDLAELAEVQRETSADVNMQLSELSSAFSEIQ